MLTNERPTFLDELNEAQRQAALHSEGPAMIIAGAGSGKTRTLTYRLAHLIDTGQAKGWDLLALTFTNKAAREMKERIEGLIGTEAKNITMGTFHSVFARILRVEGHRLNYTRDFSIYDEDDVKALIKRICKDLQLDDKKFKPRNVRHAISLAKNALIGAKQYAVEYVEDEQTEVVSRVYKAYTERLLRANAMDFDDLLFNTALLLNIPEVLHKYQHKWTFIMVDEYQDTNEAQYMITKRLAAVHENLVVVGDDAQSIYSFRGANIQNILNFQKDYPDYEVFKLEQNYRSTQTIVSAANQLIRQNEEQIPKTVFTENETGEPIKLIIARNDLEEAQKVVDLLREQKLRLSLREKDFAILYRTNAQSRSLEDQLRRAGLRYKIYGGISFYDRKEIRDMLAYLRLLVNPSDDEALARIINVPIRGIGKTTIQNIQVAAQDNDVPMWTVVTNAGEFKLGRNAKVVREFGLLVESLQAEASRLGVGDLVQLLAKQSGILRELQQENTTDSLSRWENVQELVNAATTFQERVGEENATLADFLEEVALMTSADDGDDDDNHVTLMTVHAAKGLEFPSVFVTGLEEGLFPLHMAMMERADLEEERRLFYVAVTRAEKLLTLTAAEQRMRFGEVQQGEPSRFLHELGEDHLHVLRQPQTAEREQSTPKKKPQPAKQQPARLTPVKNSKGAAQTPSGEAAIHQKAKLREGAKVEHSKFGVGIIRQLGEDRMVVDFANKKNATLLLKFARVRVLE